MWLLPLSILGLNLEPQLESLIVGVEYLMHLGQGYQSYGNIGLDWARALR